MKRIRKICQNPTVIMLVLFNFIFVSCNRDEIISNNVSSNNKLKEFAAKNNQYTDIDVFKGVVFQEGIVAEKFLGDFNELNFRNYAENETEIKNIISFQNTIVSYIGSNDPDYFSKFRTEIGSGDYKRVNAIINDTAVLIRDITFKLGELSDDDVVQIQKTFEESFAGADMTNGMSKQQIQTFVQVFKKKQASFGDQLEKVWFWKYAAVAYALVAVVLAAAILVLEKIDPGSQNHLDGSNFYNDNFQAEITLQLEGI